jgi:hypothetical protein
MSAPTTDEQEIERRARERDRWNEAYGKVLSGTGTDEEIRAFYDERARLSGDYVEFATYLIDHYGEVLPERDVSLLTLARRLHLARLEEIPRRLEEALQRRDEQDEARRRWQEDERAFNADDTAAPDAPAAGKYVDRPLNACYGARSSHWSTQRRSAVGPHGVPRNNWGGSV